MDKKMIMKLVERIALILVIVGGINWGLEVAGLNLLTLLSFGMAWLVTAYKILVAVSAVIVALVTLPKIWKK